MAKTTPAEFINQVQAERKKIVWPTWKETWVTAVMVGIMAVVLGLFFFSVDSVFGAITRSVIEKIASIG